MSHRKNPIPTPEIKHTARPPEHSIHKLSDGRYRLDERQLAAAARRDRAWHALPKRRFGPEQLARYSERRWQRHRRIQRSPGPILGGRTRRGTRLGGRGRE